MERLLLPHVVWGERTAATGSVFITAPPSLHGSGASWRTCFLHADSQTRHQYHQASSANTPDPIRIRSGLAGKPWQKRAGWFLHIGLLPDRICLAKTWHDQPELNRIRAGFAQYYPILSWKEQNRVWEWETGSGPVASCQKPGPMIPAHQLASRKDEFGQTMTRPSRSDPSRFCVILCNMIYPFFGKTKLKRLLLVGSGIYDPGRLWLHAGHNSHDWP